MGEAGAGKRSWWRRNWKWVIPLGCFGVLAGFLAFVALIVALAFGVLREAAPCQEALEKTRASRSAVQALGEPIEMGWFVIGTVDARGPGGVAKVSIPVHGPKGRGRLYVEATRRTGGWEFQTLTLEVEGRPAPIDVLEDQGVPTSMPARGFWRLARAAVGLSAGR